MPDRRVFCGHDGGTGCGWYRMILPLGELGKQPGWSVTMASGNLVERQGLRASEMEGHDIIVGQRLNSPRGMHVWREARTPRTRLVYELDDDVFHLSPENWAAYQLWKREDVRDAAIHCIEVSDLVTTTTEPLADVFREYNPNVLVIPNHIPGWVCDYQRKRRDRPCLGWAGGASHGLDVNEIVAPVKRFLRRFPKWDLRLGGTDYRPTFRVGERASYYPWTHVTDDPRGFYTAPDFDIGLAPLVRSQFTKCKSAVKALEWGALGIPVIATDWAPYSDYIRHGENGFLVKHDHEWLHFMSLLASDENLREEMGNKAREVARQYAVEAGWRLWADAYESLFSR